MSKPRVLILLLTLVIVTGVGVWVFRRTRPQPTPQWKTVRVGFLPIYVDLPLFVAQERGFFARRGVTVDPKRFEQSADIGVGILTNDLDAGASVSTGVVLSIESRDPGKLNIFIVDAENRDNYLSSFVVLKDSGIRSINDLRGKKIASFPGTTANTFGKMVLEKYGINPARDLEWSELASTNHLSALQSKAVDALFTYEPIATEAVMEKNAIKLIPAAVETNVISPWQAGVWIINSRFLSDNPELAKQFILALYDAIDFIRQSPEEAKRDLVKYTSIKPTVAAVVPSIPFTKLDEIDKSTLQKHANIMTERKVISKSIQIDKLLLPLAALK